MTIRQLLFKVFSYLPDGPVKENLAGKYYSLLLSLSNNKESRFKIRHENGAFVADFNGKSYNFAINPMDELSFSFHGYLKYHQPKEGDIVIDGGAFPGEFSLVCSTLVGETGRVIAFEPDPGNYQHVKKLLERNGVKNVILLNRGLWNSDSTLRFESEKAVASKVVTGEAPEGSKLVEVQCVSLDEELERLKIGRANFIKLDIEGAEMNALLGAKELLTREDVRLAIASYHVVDGKMTWGPVEEILSGYGYKPFTENLVALTAPHESYTTFAAK